MSEPTVIVDHQIPRVTVACAICNEHREMPWEGPLPQLVPMTPEGQRFSDICRRFSRRLGAECKYAETETHTGSLADRWAAWQRRGYDHVRPLFGGP